MSSQLTDFLDQDDDDEDDHGPGGFDDFGANRRKLVFLLPILGIVPLAIGLFMQMNPEPESASDQMVSQSSADLEPVSKQKAVPKQDPAKLAALTGKSNPPAKPEAKAEPKATPPSKAKAMEKKPAPSDREAIAKAEKPAEKVSPPAGLLPVNGEPTETEAAKPEPREIDDKVREEIAARLSPAPAPLPEKKTKPAPKEAPIRPTPIAEEKITVPEPAPDKPKAVQYTVKSGDTLYGIGRKNSLPPQEIAKASGISMNDTLKVGQKLTIPPNPEDVREHAALVEESRQQRQAPATTTRTETASASPKTLNPVSRPASSAPAPTLTPAPATSPASPRVSAPAPAPKPSTSRPAAAPALAPAPVSNPSPGNQRTTTKSVTCIAYVVQSHDTLQSIADAHSTSIPDIQTMNGYQSIYAGRTILVPVSGIVAPCDP